MLNVFLRRKQTRLREGIWIIDLRFDFDNILAALDRDGFVGEDAFEVVEKLLCLAGAEIGVGVLVVPHQSALFGFYG